jgi:hypothetical protein
MDDADLFAELLAELIAAKKPAPDSAIDLGALIAAELQRDD